MYGLDTGFLVAAEVTEHADHANARAVLARLLGAGAIFAIAPQVLAEFIHIVTDPRRFTHPLDMATDRRLAEQWWTASDVVWVELLGVMLRHRLFGEESLYNSFG